MEDANIAMGVHPFARRDRAHPAFFWLGAGAVALGVALHLPMFFAAAAMNYRLAGMPIDGTMLAGMALIVAGTAASWYGLLPAKADHERPSATALERAGASPGDGQRAEGKLAWQHRRLMLVLALGLVIDSMKPASLGFTIPGMSEEYELSREVVALFPFFALAGLTIGSYVWGVIGDQIGRRAAILLSGIMFVGTAICGAMPGFLGNLAMCSFMGFAAGGMLPIT